MKKTRKDASEPSGLDQPFARPHPPNPPPQIFFGALRARVGGSSSDAAAAAPRLLSFLWVGPAVSPLRRGKAALHRNAVRDGAMGGGGVLRGEVSLWDEGAEAVVGEEELVARVRAALGAGVAAEGAVVLVLAS